MSEIKFIPSDWVPENSNIKAIGVGGGGCNAVTHMYNERIEGCTFIVCNTDAQALEDSNVPIKVHMGKGLGAGCDPIKGRNAAQEALPELEQALGDGTEMLFITAGMGGGTGTGAAPIIASMARKKGILTVGVVTIPFVSEGRDALVKAVNGVKEMEKYVDSLLVINNQKLYEVYGEMLVRDAYFKADEILATAVRGIVDIIKKKGYVNVDMEDVKTMMHDSGIALMGIGVGSGENRLEEAVQNAVVSPLLNKFNLNTAKNLLVNITFGNSEEGLQMNEMDKIDKILENYTGTANRFKKGIVLENDPEFGDKVSITVIATGFEQDTIGGVTDETLGNIITIDSDFEYKGTADIVSDDAARGTKITPGDNRNERRFNFTEAPVLCDWEGQKRYELENTPSIRRTKEN